MQLLTVAFDQVPPLLAGAVALLAALAGRRLPLSLRLLALACCPLLFVAAHWRERGERQPQSAVLFPYGASPAGEQATAWTDRGAPVTLQVVAAREKPATTGEETVLRSRGVEFRVIRTAPQDWSCNCHGWVYAAGRYLIDSGDVPAILRDNGYRAVLEPRAGDLAVFRDDFNEACHSAVVRQVCGDGLVLLESKWGHLGRYLHRPEDYPYSTRWNYYRSARAGHLLAGIDASPSAEQTIPCRSE